MSARAVTGAEWAAAGSGIACGCVDPDPEDCSGGREPCACECHFVEGAPSGGQTCAECGGADQEHDGWCPRARSQQAGAEYIHASRRRGEGGLS